MFLMKFFMLFTTFSLKCCMLVNSFKQAPQLKIRRSLFSTLCSSNNNNPPNANTKKVIVVTGGVISGIGKGITASSIGVVLKMLGLRPTAMKIDPYLNVDAGTMSPFEHGETFVLDDGAETDLDLGNYERFLDVKLTHDSSLTTGKVYQEVIAKERRGDYLGKTVQIIPHITDEIMHRILSVLHKPVDDSNEEPDVCIVELGGTIGDIESMPFVEAIRQLQLKLSPVNLCLVHVSMVPTVGESGEQKTKPTQHSVKELRSLGLTPDFIVCRSKVELETGSRNKISLFCNVPVDNVLSMYDLSNVYHAPLVMMQQNFHQLLSQRLQLDIPSTTTLDITQNQSPFYHEWKSMATKMDMIKDIVTIVLIGKYTNLDDSYVSIVNAIKHSCVASNQKLNLIMIESTKLEEETKISAPEIYEDSWGKVKKADGVVVPGGFGTRGIEGKIKAIQYVREHKIPFLGVCLGMQMAVIEYTRNVLHIPNANSEEIVPNPVSPQDSAIIFMPEGSKDILGGTMRLGARETIIQPKTIANTLYQHSHQIKSSSSQSQLHSQSSSETLVIEERHRHRYEVNPSLVPTLESAGLIFSGKDTTGQRMEIIELSPEKHPYFVGVQFHPEFNSRPLRPAPTFLGLLQAIKKLKSEKSI